MNKKAQEEVTSSSSVNTCEDDDDDDKLNWRSQNVDWFIHFWNQKRVQYQSRLPKLLLITKGQKDEVRKNQARWGIDIVRQAVINVMTSDVINARTGKRFVFSLDWMLSKEYFPLVAQGKYNDLAPEDRPLTEQERRKQAEEERQREAEERRRKNLEIDQQIREEQRRAREEAHANRATPEQLDEIFKNFKLPPLKK